MMNSGVMRNIAQALTQRQDPRGMGAPSAIPNQPPLQTQMNASQQMPAGYNPTGAAAANAQMAQRYNEQMAARQPQQAPGVMQNMQADPRMTPRQPMRAF